MINAGTGNEAVEATQTFTYPSPFRAFWSGFSANRGAVIGLAFMLLVLFCALFAPLLGLHDPIEQFRDASLLPPAWYLEGTWTYPLGTDEVGRDLLSRLCFGARVSLLVGLCAVLMSLIPGVALGLAAGFFPKVTGKLIMRAMDIMMALPALLLAVAIMSILGQGIINAMIAIAIVALPGYVRLVRASVSMELGRDYVIASRMNGAGLLRLMFLTVLPNCLAPLIVHATLSFSSAILEVAALGFLGFGVQPPTAEWGTMLAAARDYMDRAWWVVTLPGVTILLSVLAINLIGDGLRDTLDPKLKRVA